MDVREFSTKSNKKEEIQKLVEKTAADLNYLVYESSALISGNNSSVVVKIDSLQGISHNDCVVFSRELSKRLDASELLPNYSMEISSPGLFRKLRDIGEFARFKGSISKVVYEANGETKVVKGIINNIIDTKIELKSDNDEIIIIDFETVKKANLEY